ncbi:MAG: enoyl-CoA hydratase/isomerase family protein [Paracoccaceae bacterium]
MNVRAWRQGRAGRITLARPQALNALSLDMVRAVQAALDGWRNDPGVAILVIDAEGDRAFCAGGDIRAIHAAMTDGRPEDARRLFREQYAMDHALFTFPRPVVSLMQGFVMGGGIGVGCHASHRVLAPDATVATPECGIGLVPDVGSSLILARAPGRLGEYLGTTGARMDAADAVHAGFADYVIDRAAWPGLIEALCESGDPSCVDAAAGPVPDSALAARQPVIDAHFAGERLGDVMRLVEASGDAVIARARKAMSAACPLSMAATIEIVHRARLRDRIDEALRQEYRFAHRAVDGPDLAEGIRAAVIDRATPPRWRHAGWRDVTVPDVTAMTLPLGPGELRLT